MTIENEQVEDRGDAFTPEEITGQEIELDASDMEELDAFNKLHGEEGAADDTDEPPADEKAGAIPKARLDAEIAKRNAEAMKRKDVETENATLKAQLAERSKPAETVEEVAAEPQPDSLEALRAELRDVRKKGREALLDGELELCDELTDKADELVEQIAEKKAHSVNTTTKAATDLASALDSVAAKAYEKYPFLDVSNKETVDADAVSLVISRRNELIKGGMSQPAALQQAIDEKAPKFAKLYGLVDSDGKETAAAKTTREAREKAARDKNANASLRQPGQPLGSEKEGTFKVNVAKISDEEFDALPEKVKAKMRGDTV